MSTQNIPYENIIWDNVPKEEHKGEQGTSFWKVKQYRGLRVRIVEYTAGYMADHWCQKGHIVHCLEGEFTSELENGEVSLLTEGMTYVVSDDLSSHRSSTQKGAKLMIIDGDFLKSNQV
ncbi:MAG TPA: DHCW motif cupin fold protein [Spirochaetota bacterium]|nr:DHCW motif cupin fold protein [Spirochaetota bacterium]